MLAFQEQLQQQLPETLHFEFEQRDQEGVLLDAKVGQAYADLVTTLYGGKAARVPGPGGEEGGNTQPTIDDSGGLISKEEGRSMLATAGVIPANWTAMDEDVTSTDAKNIEEKDKKEQLMENETIRRAIFQFPNEPIVRYSWPNNRTEVLFSRGNEALKASRYSVVKPAALIPDFTGSEPEEVKQIAAPVELSVQKRVSGFNMYRGDTPPLTVNVKDKEGREIDVSKATEITYFVHDKAGKMLLIKELGRGIKVDRSRITIEYDPEDTFNLLGHYSHNVKVMDDLGRTWTVFQGEMAVLEEFVDGGV